MDRASGHWPVIVLMCVWMRASCLGWRVVLWVRGTGIMVTGCKTKRGPCTPLRGDTWPWDPPDRASTPQGDSSPTSQAAWRADGGSSLAVRLLVWGRRDEISSSVISVFCVCTHWWQRDPRTSGNNKAMTHSTIHSMLPLCILLDFTLLWFPCLFSSVLSGRVESSLLNSSALKPTSPTSLPSTPLI